MFHGIEKLYGHCVAKIQAGQTSTTEEYFGLILMMFDVHLRNAAYENRTGQEGVSAYKLRLHLFKREFIMGRSDGEDAPDKEVADQLKRNWRVRVLTSRSGHSFITSDHPSAWVSVGKGRPGLNLVILPVTPTHVAIAFDRRIVDVVGSETTTEDDGRINRCQVMQALRSVYSPTNCDEEEGRAIEQFFKHKRVSKGRIGQGSWEAGMLRLPSKSAFSFLRLQPPRF
jgi:hypothetical protein